MALFIPDNRITLLRNGGEYFPAVEAAIDAAQHEIFLETYIFASDDIGRTIAAALVRAARRGVATRVIVDGFGSRLLALDILTEMQNEGVEVLVYRSEIARFKMRRHRLRRMHRKIVLVDGCVAFVGGINVIDDVHTPGHTPPRIDYAVKVEGPLLTEIYPVVYRLWQLLRWTHFKHRWDEPSAFEVADEPIGSQLAAFVIRDNLGHRGDIEEAYLEAINAARHEIVIANAYFLPGLSFRHALMDAAARGVRVVLLLQGRVEYVLLHYASRALYGSLLEAGIEIYEYHKSFLHAKVAVVDSYWATVGSSNIDPFSMLLSREANICIGDGGFARELRSSLEAVMQTGARPVARLNWYRRPLMDRVAAWLSYGFARVVMGMLGYAQK